MEASPAFKMPARDGQPLPLHPLSPERVNGRLASKHSRTASDFDAVEPSSTHSSPTRKANLFADYHPVTTNTPSKSQILGGGAGLPQSPSMPEFTNLRSHVRTNSDVQGLVKRFEHLDVRDRDAEVEKLRRKHEMELRRAQLGREEAESESRKWRGESARLAEELKESRTREGKVSNRLDKVMSDYTHSKEKYDENIRAYDKEVRKARKEAFKSASAVLKLQESLRDMGKRLEASNVDRQTSAHRLQMFEQELGNAQTVLQAANQELSSMTSDLERVRRQLEVAEAEKAALKTNLQEEEVARIALEGRIALPASQEDDEDLFSSPRKPASPKKLQRSPLSDDKENVGVVTKKMMESKRLQEEVEAEKIKREAAEEMVEFLRMECAFKCCGCATTAGHGRAMRLSMDDIVASSIQRMKADMTAILSPPLSEEGIEQMEVDGHEHADEPVMAEPRSEQQLQPPEETAAQQKDESMTLAAEDEPALPELETLQAPHPTPAESMDDALPPLESREPSSTTQVPVHDSPPSTPTQATHSTHHQTDHPIRTITTTTKIPMHFTPLAKTPHDPEDTENVPPTSLSNADCAVSDLPFDREAALAAIAYRRGRAKSLAQGTLTPRKQMLEGVGRERRDISAPALGAKNTAVLASGQAKAPGSVGRNGGRVMGM